MYIVTSICSSILSQHALGDCTIKFESTSFRILLSAGYSNREPFDAVEDVVSSQQSAVSSLPSKSKSLVITVHRTISCVSYVVTSKDM